MENKKISWYIVNKEYVDFLQKFDEKVQNIDYNSSAKPYIGIVLSINEFEYYVPISSVKEKHYKMHENIDFLKVNYEDELLSVINLNNMIPIQKENVIKLDYSEISKYVCFNDDLAKTKYIALLRKEISLINKRKDDMLKRAKKLYEIKYKFPDAKVSKRCCDFKLLEQKSKEYTSDLL